MLTEGPVVASWWQGVASELMGTTGRAPNNESGGGAHRGWRSTMRRGGGLVRWRAVGSSLEGGSVVEDMRSLGLSHFGRENADAELTEEGNGGGALAQIWRGWWHFYALDRCMGFVEGGERGCR
jgi:hypothetical protein